MHSGLNNTSSALNSEQTAAMPSLDNAREAASLAENRLREAIDAMPQGIVFLDEEERYILWNKRYAQIYENTADLLKPGIKLEDVLRAGIQRGSYPDAIGQEEQWLAERLVQLRAPGQRQEQRLSNGRCVLIEERRTVGGGTIGIRVDITELKQTEATFRQLFEQNPLSMLVYDRQSGKVRAANEALCSYLGYTLEDLQGMHARNLFPDDVQESALEFLACEQFSGDQDQSWCMVRSDGVHVEAILSTRLSHLEDYQGTIVSIFDVTERRHIEQRMAHMARHDELTGLANRTHCYEHLNRLLASASLQTDELAPTITLALIDLDHFKAVNDTHGHPFGDIVLTAAACRMTALIPPNAFLSRIGGDEFAIIFHGSSLLEAEIISKSIITSLCEPFFADSHMVHIGATVGIASSPRDSLDAETLMRFADLALFTAKQDRRGSCRGFETYMDDAAQEKNRLEKDLREAVRNNDLVVHYQPIIDLDTGEIQCYEALLRWKHPKRGSVSPDVFIPIAEEIGLIDQIGRYVLNQACTEAVKWPEHISLAVNVSPLQFRNGNLLSTVINAITSSGLAAERLELEITEALLLEKGPRPAAILRNLRAFGVGISLDDFGTGYSSLSYLLNYPFTKIKIDKSFTLNLSNDETARAVIRAVIGLGRNLGLTVTAEGVEKEDDRIYLRDEGCSQGQGYLFGKAAPAPSLNLASN